MTPPFVFRTTVTQLILPGEWHIHVGLVVYMQAGVPVTLVYIILEHAITVAKAFTLVKIMDEF